MHLMQEWKDKSQAKQHLTNVSRRIYHRVIVNTHISLGKIANVQSLIRTEFLNVASLCQIR